MVVLRHGIDPSYGERAQEYRHMHAASKHVIHEVKLGIIVFLCIGIIIFCIIYIILQCRKRVKIKDSGQIDSKITRSQSTDSNRTFRSSSIDSDRTLHTTGGEHDRTLYLPSANMNRTCPLPGMDYTDLSDTCSDSERTRLIECKEEYGTLIYKTVKYNQGKFAQ